jgi:ribulose-5-phosphate 4-epimerase/fuculose-1-phosphate aldolase
VTDSPAAEVIISEIIDIGRLMYDRFLTDAAGGNISVKSWDRIYLTPRYAGARYHWRLPADLINVLDLQHNVLAGPTPISRESEMHLALFDAFPEAGSVIHAHAPNLMVFASAERPMPPVMEYTQKFGTIGLTAPAASHTPRLAVEVVAYMNARRSAFAKSAQAVLLPGHGVVVMAHDLLEAYDVLERLERNAHCLLLRPNLPASSAEMA